MTLRAIGLTLAALLLLAACAPSQAVGTQASAAVTATSAPGQAPAVTPAQAAEVRFWPEPGRALPASGHFGFGAWVSYTGAAAVTAHAVAFTLKPGEALIDCATRTIPTDRPFWADQQTFAPGPHIFQREFAYAEPQPGADRLVVRLNLLGAGDQLLFCRQQAYPLTTGAPTPLEVAFPTVAVTPADVTATPPPPLAWNVFSDTARLFHFEYPAAYDTTMPAGCALRQQDGQIRAGDIVVSAGPAGGLDIDAYADQFFRPLGDSYQIVGRDSSRLAREPRGLIIQYFFRGSQKSAIVTFFQRGEVVYTINSVLTAGCISPELGIDNPAVYYHVVESFRFEPCK